MDTLRNNRIGILGGTFNPIHLGHLILAQSAVEACDLAKVWFIPTGTPAHKHTAALAPAAHRLAMVQAAVEGDLRFEASDLEIRRGGVSYAIDTVKALQQEHPAAELYFIIGSDTLRELHQWKDAGELLTLCRFVAFARPGFEPAQWRPEDLRLAPPQAQALLAAVHPGRQIDISSSDIRHRIAEGLSIRYLVPEAVEMYIAEHGLYV